MARDFQVFYVSRFGLHLEFCGVLSLYVFEIGSARLYHTFTIFNVPTKILVSDERHISSPETGVST